MKIYNKFSIEKFYNQQKLLKYGTLAFKLPGCLRIACPPLWPFSIVAWVRFVLSLRPLMRLFCKYLASSCYSGLFISLLLRYILWSHFTHRHFYLPLTIQSLFNSSFCFVFLWHYPCGNYLTNECIYLLTIYLTENPNRQRP